MNEIIKRGSAQWYVIEKKGTFLQNDNSFKNTLTDMDDDKKKRKQLR